MDKDIIELDLEPIAYKVCRDEGFTIEEVDNAIEDYRIFLQLIRNSEPGSLVAPTSLIDIVWHHHILDTLKYMDDCSHIFGRYIHHYPYSGIFGKEDAEIQNNRVDNTIRLIQESYSVES